MLEPATEADIAEVRRRLDAFTAPSFDRGIVEKLIARLDAVGGEPVQAPAVRVKDAGHDATALTAARKIMELTGKGKYDDHLKAKIQCVVIDAIRSALEAETGGGEKIDVRQTIRDIESGKTLGFLNKGEHAEEADDTDLNCPHCGGSGHKGDVATPPDERAVEALRAIVARSNNDPLGTSKVNDMRTIALVALATLDALAQGESR